MGMYCVCIVYVLCFMLRYTNPPSPPHTHTHPSPKAYHVIHPMCGAAKADVWRYAILYTYGGVYIDEDSDIATPLDEVIGHNDRMIVTHERNNFNGDACYLPQYHLSNAWTFKQPSAHVHQQGEDGNGGKGTTIKIKDIFYGRIIPNWLMMSSPGHIVLRNCLFNIVEIIRSTYMNRPFVRHLSMSYG